MTDTPASSPAPRRALFTGALIAVCVAVYLVSGGASSWQGLRPFLFATRPGGGWDEILAGQVWRLLTPIFVHSSLLHLTFNMLNFWVLGRLLEQVRSRLHLALMVLTIGIGSNVTQYLATGYPVFGGMSGVLYGWAGYIWLESRLNPRFGFALTGPSVAVLAGWFLLCWTGLLGPIANWAHTGGLALGLLWGWLDRDRPSLAAPSG